MRCFIIIFLFLASEFKAQPPLVITRVLSKPKDGCEIQVKVKDNYPQNCDRETGCNYLYPVLVEEFDYNYDLPNKWSFDLGYTKDDDVDLSNDQSTWFGDAFYEPGSNDSITNRNIILSNSVATFSLAIGTVTRINNGSNNPYPFTSGMINSLSRFRTGIFEARIKVPTANKMWPAFWLLNNQNNYSEIDILEYFDDDVDLNNACTTYSLHQMTLHGGPTPTTNSCHRGDKYPFLDLSVWHEYKLDWNDYEIKIYVDGILKGYASKFYQLLSPQQACFYGYAGSNFDPGFNFSCEELQNLPDNIAPQLPYIDYGPRPWWVPSFISWPPPQPPQPYIANKVKKDLYFPHKYNAMSLIINNSANRTYKNDNFTNFPAGSLNMEVDWVRVYQPFCCGVDKTVCTLNDLDAQTYFTGILTGRNLKVGCPNIPGAFRQFKPGTILPGTVDPNWRDQPVILLATDEIAITGDASFEGDTYAEMRITDCGYLGKSNPSESKQLLDFYESQNKIKDSLFNSYSQLADSLAIVAYDSTMKYYKDKYYNNPNDFINVGPIPTNGQLEVITSNEVFEQILVISIINSQGDELLIPTGKIIKLDGFEPGVYQLKFGLKNGTYIVKKIVKL